MRHDDEERNEAFAGTVILICFIGWLLYLWANTGV